MWTMTTETKKSLGQHWLDDKASLAAMCDAAAIQEGDVVLEIGPGTGELTQKLLDIGAHVTALEIDDSLHRQLIHRFSSYPHFHLIKGDIRTFDLSGLRKPYKIVANIPYYLTSHLLRMLSEAEHRPRVAALLVQKEVAERVIAAPGDMSLLSVTTQFYWDVSAGQLVPKQLFTPPPKVDSQILILKQRSELLFEVDEKKYFQVVKAGFSARRKKLRSSIAAGLRIDKPRAEALLKSVGVNPSNRAQALTLTQWRDIYDQAIDQSLL